MNNYYDKENGVFIIALSRALRALHRKSEAMFRNHGLTLAQFAVLEALHHKGELTVGALIESVLSTSGNMTVVIRNLEQHELVCRKTNPSDGRSFLVALTDKGAKLIGEVFEQHMTLVEESLAPITPEERNTVIQILRKLSPNSSERNQ